MASKKRKEDSVEIEKEENADDEEIADAAEEESDGAGNEEEHNSDDGEVADANGDGPEDAGGAAGDRQRLKLIQSRRKQLLNEIRDEQNAKIKVAQEQSAKDRLKFLLQQTEIYTHFIKPTEATAASKNADKSKGSPARRAGRMTEKEEDDEILKEAQTDTPAIQLTSTPPFIKHAPMRDYQIAGLNWLVRLHDQGINGILADEMGLGKTLQTISFLGYLKHVRGIDGPHLIITPKSTLGNWLNECHRWCPSLRVFKLHGNQEERAEQKATKFVPGQFDAVVTTYEVAIREKAALKKFHYRYIIVDEAHRIKNEKSILSQVVRLYRAQNRLLLTGTPLQNNLHELWALLNFLLPEVFSSSEDFDSWFDLKGDGNKQEVIEKLHKVLRPFLLRRLKADVEKSLPPKKEVKLFVGLSELQKQWYKKILLRDIEAVNGGGGKGSRVRLLNIVMQLRKAANHPYLFDGAEPYPFTNGEHLMASAGKLVLLDKLLPKLHDKGSRVLIFSQMTRLLDILEDYMLMRKWEYCRIDGSTAGEDREAQIDEYNKPGSTKFVFLLSTRAGGLGINLATADTVILYDSDWNPQVDLQAQDRAHRIGQKKQVNVYRLVTEGTIEEKIVERAEQKLQLDALVIQQGRLVEQNRALSKDELLGMIKFGADQIFSGSGGTITDEDIDAILSRGEQKTEEMNAKLKSNIQRRLLDFSLDGGASLYSFEGVDYSQAGKEKSLLASWIEPPKRERKLQGYGVNEYYRNAMRVTEPKKPSAPRPPKQPVIHDFQFYPQPLYGLLERETAAYRKKLEWLKAKEEKEKAEEEKAAAGGTVDKDKPKEGDEEPEPDFGELSPEEELQKQKMLEQGMSNWLRRDFNAFVRGSEKYGRKDFANIAKECEKEVKDVQAYAAVFWARGPELADWDRTKKRIEEGELRIQRREEMTVALDEKMRRYKNPWVSLKLNYGMKKGKQYIEEEDVFLVCMTHKLGYGNWEQLKLEIRKAWQFRFDWFLKSRSPQELQRRVETLIRLIEKENEELRSKERVKKKNLAAEKGTEKSAKSKRAPEAGEEKASKKAKKDNSAAQSKSAKDTAGPAKKPATSLSKRRKVPIVASAGANV